MSPFLSFVLPAVRDIGLKLLSICLGCVTLGMGETFADFPMTGMCPDLIELFDMAHTGPPSTPARLHSTQFGSPLGPVDV